MKDRKPEFPEKTAYDELQKDKDYHRNYPSGYVTRINKVKLIDLGSIRLLSQVCLSTVGMGHGLEPSITGSGNQGDDNNCNREPRNAIQGTGVPLLLLSGGGGGGGGGGSGFLTSVVCCVCFIIR